ncbi:MAG: sensor histidine kinase, partial [Chloroflexota bacterium]
ESGQAQLRLATVRPEDLVRRAMERLSPLAERAGVLLEVPETLDLPDVLADRERISQVLTNVVHNAIKFTPPGGRVSITARVSGRNLAFAVADSGIGIADEDLPRIFERFYKADRARASGGTGLGLAIAKHLVQAHGGTIWAESRGPGRGSVFTFTLPVA